MRATLVLACPTPVVGFNGLRTQKRTFCTPSESTVRTVCRNRHGEEIVFIPCNPPTGYTFVVAGNIFLTRRCRKLAQTLYAVYRPKGRKKHAMQLGIYAPNDVFKQANLDFQKERAKLGKKLLQTLDESYPRIPSADRDNLHDLISSQSPTITGNALLRHLSLKVYAYVLDRYTPFKSLAFHKEGQHSKAIAQVHQTAEEILAFWRRDRRNEGKQQSKKSRQDNKLRSRNSKS